MMDAARAIVGLGPSFSAHVGLGDRGHPSLPFGVVWVEVCALSALCALWVEVCALSALCAVRVRFHRFFMPEVQNCSRSPTIHSRGRCPARSDLRFD